MLTVSAFAQKEEITISPETPDTISSAWSFAASALHYILPVEKDFTIFIGSADYKALHLEARYNYEDLNTVSVFGGYRFETGYSFILGVTPMAGFVFGNTDGVIPGLELDMTWRKLDFYAESEYVIDFAGSENNYFYTWSELAITPLKHIRTGISANRTRLYQTELDLQRGVFVQYSFWELTTGVHYFNPLSSNDFFIATLDYEF